MSRSRLRALTLRSATGLVVVGLLLVVVGSIAVDSAAMVTGPWARTVEVLGTGLMVIGGPACVVGLVRWMVHGFALQAMAIWIVVGHVTRVCGRPR